MKGTDRKKRAPRFPSHYLFVNPEGRSYGAQRLMRIHPLITKSEDLQALVDLAAPKGALPSV